METEEMRKRKERVQTILRTSKIVKDVLGMGFPEQVVETVVEERILSHTDSSLRSDVYESVHELIDDVMEKGEEQASNQANCSNPSGIRRGSKNNLGLVRSFFRQDMDTAKLMQPFGNPGHKFLYIPPDDTCREDYRLSTFKNFPNTDRDFHGAYALNGFYYTGFRDRVRCFSCGLTVEAWCEGNNPTEQVLHKSSCLFKRGISCGNIPIRHNRDAQSEAAAMERENVTSNKHRSFLTDSDLKRKLDWHPVHPQMRGQTQREATFDKGWPAGRIDVSYAQMAEAGFFWGGEQDKVKCWYCNGGLQNWEFRDDLWVELEKWFPRCPLVNGRQHGSPGTYPGKLRNDTSSPPNKSIPTVNPQAPLSRYMHLISYYEADDIRDEELYGGDPGQEDEEPTGRESIEALQQQLNRMIDERMCKVCYSRASEMSFAPCGHMVCCMYCAAGLTNCPTCRSCIQIATKVY